VEYIFCIVMLFWKIQERRQHKEVVDLCVFLSLGSCFTHPSCPVCLLPHSTFPPVLSWHMPRTNVSPSVGHVLENLSSLAPLYLRSKTHLSHYVVWDTLLQSLASLGMWLMMQSALLGYWSIFCLMTYHLICLMAYHLIYAEHVPPVANQT
jgi:hypothetical protein